MSTASSPPYMGILAGVAGLGFLLFASRRLRTPLSWLARLCRSVLLFSHSLLPGSSLPHLSPNRLFRASFEAVFGPRHPALAEGVLVDALAKAKRDCKFLLVYSRCCSSCFVFFDASLRYLHSPHHGDTEAFCRNTLTSEAVTEFVDENFVFWAADTSSPAGLAASTALRVSSYPYLSVLYLAGESARGQEIRRLGFWVGPLTVDELLVALMGVLEEVSEHGVRLLVE